MSWGRISERTGRLRLALALIKRRRSTLAVVVLVLTLAGGTLARGSEPRDTYETTITADAPVAQYRFEDAGESSTLADSAGSNDATNHGVALSGEGPFGGSASGLFGGEGYASLAANPLEGVSEFTAEAWVDWSGGSSYDQPIFDFGSSATNHLYLTPAESASGHELLLELHPTEGASAQVTAPELGEGTWHYLAVTESSTGTLKLYLDGAEVGHTEEAEVSPASLGSAPAAYFGKSLASAPDFDGSLSNLAFYDKALSAGRIKAHYDAGEFPVNAKAPAISGTPEDEQLLTAHAEDWTGLEPIGFGYQWLRCNGAGEGCSGISGAEGSGYEASFADVGHRLRVRLTGTNAAGSGEALSSPSAFIAPTPLSELGYASEFGSEGSGDGQFNEPFGVAANSNGEIFVLDRGNDRVEKFSEAGEYLGQFGAEGSGDGQLLRADALAIDAKGDVWVADTANKRIEEFDGDGEFIRTAGEELVGYPEGIAVDRTGHVWVSDSSEGHLVVFSEEGEHLKDVGSYGSEPGQFNEPAGLAVDTAGHVWVVDHTNERVQELNEAGEYLSQFGSEGAAAGGLNGPYGIALDEGHVFLSEFGFSRVLEFSDEGGFIAQLGVPGSESGQLGFAGGLAVDPAHELLIADPSNNRVQRLSAEAPAAPASLAVPSLWGNPGVGDTYEASAGVWSGSPRRSFAFQWQRCDEHGEGCVAIEGATSSTYTVVESDLGKTVRAVVTATNSLGSASSASAPSETIVEPPASLSPPMVSGAPVEGVELAAEPGEWERAVSYSYEWQRCNAFGEECADTELFWEETYTATEEDIGHTLRVIVTAYNGAGAASATSAATAVVTGSTAPVNVSAPTITGSAEGGHTLTSSSGEWSGAPAPSYTYQWEHCNATGGECDEIAGATNSTYTLQDGDVSGSVRVLVTAANIAGSASTASVASPRIAPVGPVNGSLPSISGSATEGQTLSASPGEWSGAPAPSYTYQWKRCNSSGEACSDIAGATGAAYQLGAVDAGHTLRVRVVATNAATSATASSSATAPVESTGATAPSNTAAPVISGSPEDGQTLTVSSGLWEGTGPIVYSYEWQSCNEAGGGCEAIGGATSHAYTLGPSDEGTRLQVLVYASGPGGPAHAASALTTTVQAGAPSELEAPSISGGPSVGETLQAEHGAWSGSDVQYNYQWERCSEAGAECAQIPGAVESEYTPVEADIAGSLRLRIGAHNSQGSVTALSQAISPVQSSETLLSTAAPTITGVTSNGETLTADPGGWLGSATISYTYAWERCNLYGVECKAIEGAGAPTYSLSGSDVGHTLRVRVSASEIESSASERSAATAAVAGSGAPLAEAPPAVVGTPLVGDVLTATAGSWSGESSYSYQWVRCNEEGEECGSISGATESSYTIRAEDTGFELRAVVSATNLSGTSEAASAATIASAKGVDNAAQPAAVGTYQLGHPLQVNTGIWTGSGEIAFAYEWQRCDEKGEGCTTISGATGSAYSPIEVDSGHTLKVKITASGLEGPVSETSPATPPIGSEATAPETTSAPSIEGYLTNGDALKVDVGTWTGSEPIAYAYHWQRCNLVGATCAEIEGATSSTYTLTEADVESTIRVQVDASNSAGSESSVSEASEEVGAIGAPANIQEPVTTGQAVEGQRLFVENGRWSGSTPFTYHYRWERCNTAGESCTTITGANQPSYTLASGDVGSTVRVNVSAANGLGSTGSVTPHTDIVVSATQAGISAAREAIEGADPSLFARANSATIEERVLAPAIADSEEDISSQSTLTSSIISKATPGEFSVETADGQLSFTPVEPSLSADTMPTIVNGTAALFAETWHESDVIVRPSTLGAIALLQLRSEHAPTSESWEVSLGVRQQLEQLSNGSVAIIEPTPEESLESPPGEEAALPGSSEAPAHEEGEGYGQHTGEEELNSSLAEEGAPTPLSAAPTASVTESPPNEHELHPQYTEERHELDKSAMGYAEEHTSDTALMVIEPPTVIDAAGHTVPATFTVEGDTITLTVSPESEASYPVTAEVATATPTDLVSIARDPVIYGLADSKAPVFEHLNTKLTKAPLKIKVARDFVNYDAWKSKSSREKLLEWLKAVGKHPRVKPYITLTDEDHAPKSYAEYKKDAHELMAALEHPDEAKGTPAVKMWGAMNEPDLQGMPASEAAVLWKIAAAVAAELHCGCKIAAGEFHTYDTYVGKYIGTILSNRSYTSARPVVWGIHDYTDPEHAVYHLERHEGDTALDRFLGETRGRFPGSRIWVSETGVRLQDGSNATELKTSKNHARLQVQAANDILNFANGHSRVELIDYFLYEGPTQEYIAAKHKPHAFDSALVPGEGVQEGQTPREAYCVLVLNKHKGCGAIGHTGGNRGVTASAATVTASVEPYGLPTTYAFQYGTTTEYGDTTTVTALPSETGEQTATAALSSLSPCTTYHYQIQAENEADEGVASLGGDQTFTTSGCEYRLELWFLGYAQPPLAEEGETSNFNGPTLTPGQTGTNGGEIHLIERGAGGVWSPIPSLTLTSSYTATSSDVPDLTSIGEGISGIVVRHEAPFSSGGFILITITGL
jgi:Concanavalin A-like lectin/glucanases superfamily/NHL repeat